MHLVAPISRDKDIKKALDLGSRETLTLPNYPYSRREKKNLVDLQQKWKVK